MNETYVVHVTKECNCDCKYCYEKDKSSIYTWSEVKTYLNNIIKHRTSNEFSIEFLGGEPCMAFNNIKNTIEYLKNQGEIEGFHVESFVITTNGTILTDEMIELLVHNKNIIWSVSLDGNEFMNCLRVFKDNGENTYSTVIGNLKKLLNRIHDNQYSVHMVTHPFNIGYLEEGISHLYDIGIKNIGVGTIESTITIGKEYCDCYISELKKVSDNIVGGKYSDLYVSVLDTLKPRSDIRFYIKDDSGKTLGETYGRSKNDITSKNSETGLNSFAATSPLGSLIEDIRETVYRYHQNNKLS